MHTPPNLRHARRHDEGGVDSHKVASAHRVHLPATVQRDVADKRRITQRNGARGTLGAGLAAQEQPTAKACGVVLHNDPVQGPVAAEAAENATPGARFASRAGTVATTQQQPSWVLGAHGTLTNSAGCQHCQGQGM